jgi:hypothetical protein
MPDDVLEHHDGVIDDKAYRERDGHHRKHVYGVVEKAHDDEGAQDRDGNGSAGDQCRGDRAKKCEDDKHNEHDSDDKGAVDVGDGAANDVGIVGDVAEGYAGREYVVQSVDRGLDSIGDLDGVCAGLLAYGEDDAALSVNLVAANRSF